MLTEEWYLRHIIPVLIFAFAGILCAVIVIGVIIYTLIKGNIDKEK